MLLCHKIHFIFNPQVISQPNAYLTYQVRLITMFLVFRTPHLWQRTPQSSDRCHLYRPTCTACTACIARIVCHPSSTREPWSWPLPCRLLHRPKTSRGLGQTHKSDLHSGLGHPSTDGDCVLYRCCTVYLLLFSVLKDEFAWMEGKIWSNHLHNGDVVMGGWTFESQICHFHFHNALLPLLSKEILESNLCPGAEDPDQCKVFHSYFFSFLFKLSHNFITLSPVIKVYTRPYTMLAEFQHPFADLSGTCILV